MTDYTLLNAQLASLLEGSPTIYTSLANASALIYDSLENLNWAGFYLMQDGRLVLGPFQGKPACMSIEIGKGVCGTAVSTDRTQRVANVHEFPGHIACDSTSNSEIVIPIHNQGRVIGVLDIDSPILNRFDEADQAGLETMVKTIEMSCPAAFVSMEKPCISQLDSRISVRVFEDRPIPASDKAAILASAAAAPTAGNQQLYTILDITDQDLKDLLSESCDHQPFIAKAPLVLIFLADCRKWYDAYLEAGCDARKPQAGDFLLAVDDAVIAAQNTVTAAWSLGIGSCYIGDVMERFEYHRDLLKLPPYVFPAAMVVFGYPTQGAAARKKPERFDQRYIVHENHYHPLAGPELRDMFDRRRGDQSYDDYIDAFHKRKYDSGFSREMSRSVETFIQSLPKTES